MRGVASNHRAQADDGIIPVLARHFFAKSARELGVESKRLTEEAMAFLAAFDWPGNVRQLENVCHWITVMAPAQTVEIKDLPEELRTTPGVVTEADWTQALAREVEGSLLRGDKDIMDKLARRFEAILIGKALAHTSGRRIEAAHLLGIGRNTITRKIQELEIDGRKARANT